MVPDGFGVSDQLTESTRHRDQRVDFVMFAGLDEQDAGSRVSRESMGEHTTRRTCTDDNIVKAVHVLALLTIEV